MPETLKREILKRAISHFGMPDLAVKLGAPIHLIEAWVAGAATMPDRKFLQLVDLLDGLNAK